MNAWPAKALLLSLFGLLACREEPGRCSNDLNRLCIQAELAPGLETPQSMGVLATSGAETITDTVLPGVPEAFAARRHYVLEIGVDKLPQGASVTVALRAQRGGVLFASATATVARNERARPFVVTLQAVSPDADLRPEPDLSGADLRGADLRPAGPAWPIGAAAEFSLGGGTLRTPTDVCYSGSRLYVSDTGNHRVLVYNTVTAGATPMAAVGRPDLIASTTAPAPTSQTMNAPRGLWCDNSFLLVADSGNNRVLFFSAPPATNSPADGVAGQGNFTTNSANRGGTNPAANSLSNPRGVFWDGNRLFIADRNNNRVVVYPAASKAALQNLSSGNATSVLGQGGFTTGASGTGASGLSGPEGVSVTGARVAVAEVDNNRVTVFNFTGALTTAADAAYGQPNLANTNQHLGADGMFGPSVVRATANLTYIADRLANRVLLYDTGLLSAATFAPSAVSVLGQGNFTDATPGSGATQLSRPGGATFVPDAGGLLLVVADEANGRLQVYRRSN